MKNTSIQEISKYLDINCEINTQVAGYQIDSRFVRDGDLFFALPGEKTDGHQFLREVKERGGVAAVVLKEYRGPDFGLVLLAVEDPIQGLRGLAKKFLEKWPVQIVGITGSVGKTTAKEFTATLLEGKYRVGKNVGSYNTKLSLPLTLLNRTGEEEVIVLEMGMSEPGDIAKLLEVVVPDVAVVTKVALAHAAFFPGGLQQIAEGKREIFSHVKTKISIFDHALFDEMRGGKKVMLSFSLIDHHADYFMSVEKECCLIDERGVRAYFFSKPFAESHMLHNLLSAIVVARQMNVSWDEIGQRIPFLRRPSMRCELFEKEGVIFVNDAYNANPESMRAALSSLPDPKIGGKKIALLGTMKELGFFSEASHREVGKFAELFIDHLLVLGEEALPLCEAFRETGKSGEFFLNHKDMASRLKNLMSPGDVVLIKGSRSMKMEMVLEDI